MKRSQLSAFCSVQCWSSKYLIWNSIMLFSILALIPTDSVEALWQMSPRVVHTKQTHYQGFLGPGNVPSRMGYASNGSFTFPQYNYRGYGHGQPVVEIFRGIPYASPPIGSLRYESPAPFALRSNEVYSANKTKPPCPRYFDSSMNRSYQAPDPIRTLKQFQMTAPLEDCLYLDIYAPLNTNKHAGPGLPVLVYANSHADETDDPFDGSSIAAIGQIIVVSFRYRVGVLGFLQPGYSEDVRSISNLGLWDELAALQWIRENIASFGGDEQNVCLMGFDLDASHVGMLALSPLAQAYGGLFHRLILLNGTPFSPVSINPRPLETTVRLARALKCPIHERDGELMSCLRRRPLEQLISAGQSLGSTILSYPFAPSVDGIIVKPEAADINVLDGNSELIKEILGRYDVLCGLGEGPVLPSIGKPLWHNIDLNTFATAAIKLALKLEPGSEPTEALREDFIRAIKNQYGDPPLMRDIMSDYLLINPMINFLNVHSQTGKNTFFFVSKDYDPLHKGKHTEVSYIFSNKIYKWKYVDLGQPNMDLQPFELMIVFIANFVRSGDPNTQNPAERFSSTGKTWPKYRRDPGRYLKFGRDVGVDAKYRRSQTNFWTHVFPEIIKPYISSLNPDNLNEFNNQWMTNADSKFPGHFGKNRINPNYPVEDTEPPHTLSGMTQNTVIIVGALLLLLNLLCFMGLFYQRERLKKAEVTFRKRFIEAEEVQNPEDEQRYESLARVAKSSVFISRSHFRDTVLTTTELDSSVSEPYGVVGPQRATQAPRAPLDTMSETETDNGFGPDFLGPNYDPRTKVSRWMFQQNRGHQMNYPVEPEVIVENRGHSPPPYPETVVQPQMHHGPSSSQRNSMAEPVPMEFLPPLPYQDPYRPNCPSEIPYADSRATSPSVTNFKVQTPPPPFNNNLSMSNFNYNLRRSVPSPTNSSTASSTHPVPQADKRRSRGKIAIPLRNSVIIREMDSDDEVESSAPKLVPVKTGTLTKSVGSNTNEENNELSVLTVQPRPSHHGSGQKVTFADEL